MNAAQIHLALNHAPLFLSIIGGLLLILAIVRKNDLLTSISLYMLVAAALFTAPVFLTGEGTEELVEKAVGVNEMAIESHEDMAKISLIVVIITGVLALGGLLLRKKTSFAKILLPLVILFSLASFGTMAQTAHLGGLIRHTELQSGGVTGGPENNNAQEKEEAEKMSPAVNTTDSTGQQQKKNKDEDDD
jgi:uncharacterized membrane protein